MYQYQLEWAELGYMSIAIRVGKDNGNVDTVGFVTWSQNQQLVQSNHAQKTRNQGILGYENHPTLFYLASNQA
jgi:hypothetical protein